MNTTMLLCAANGQDCVPVCPDCTTPGADPGPPPTGAVNGQSWPAAQPPPILPWNNFDTGLNDDGLAVKLIAEILQDDEWHFREDIVDEVVYECELTTKRTRKILYYLKVHGDVRELVDDEGIWIRLTTRWRGWGADA